MEKLKKQTGIQYLLAICACAAAVLLDQYTKYLAVLHLKDQDSFDLIPGVFQFHYLENQGAAFGMFQGKQILFSFGAVFIILVIGYLYGKMPPEKRYEPLRICAVLICSGAIGNMIDRVRLNYVVDFLYFELIDFPIFNVADCYVVISCFLFVYLLFFYYKEEDLECFSWKK